MSGNVCPGETSADWTLLSTHPLCGDPAMRGAEANVWARETISACKSSVPRYCVGGKIHCGRLNIPSNCPHPSKTTVSTGTSTIHH